MAIVWGIGDGVFNTQINALIGILFKNDTVIMYSILTRVGWLTFFSVLATVTGFIVKTRKLNSHDINHVSDGPQDGLKKKFLYEP